MHSTFSYTWQETFILPILQLQIHISNVYPAIYSWISHYCTRCNIWIVDVKLQYYSTMVTKWGWFVLSWNQTQFWKLLTNIHRHENEKTKYNEIVLWLSWRCRHSTFSSNKIWKVIPNHVWKHFVKLHSNLQIQRNFSWLEWSWLSFSMSQKRKEWRNLHLSSSRRNNHTCLVWNLVTDL